MDSSQTNDQLPLENGRAEACVPDNAVQAWYFFCRDSDEKEWGAFEYVEELTRQQAQLLLDLLEDECRQRYPTQFSAISEATLRQNLVRFVQVQINVRHFCANRQRDFPQMEDEYHETIARYLKFGREEFPPATSSPIENAVETENRQPASATAQEAENSKKLDLAATPAGGPGSQMEQRQESTSAPGEVVPTEVPSEHLMRKTLESVTSAERKAYLSFRYAEHLAEQYPDLLGSYKKLTYKTAYKILQKQRRPNGGGLFEDFSPPSGDPWLKECSAELEEYALPKIDTWARYCRTVTSRLGVPKKSPRAGRDTGHSVVRADQI